MMTRTLPILVWIYLTTALAGQDEGSGGVADLLPSDARIIEVATVPVRITKTGARVLVLWMQAPRRVICEWDSAGDLLYGDHWRGLTFLSLVDPSAPRLINTVMICGNPESQEDHSGAFSIPFFTYNVPYYVPHPDIHGKGRPQVMHLQDMTGEGVAGQFVLFDHVLSGIAATSVVGYSSRLDSAVQYPVERTQNRFHSVVQLWAEQVFAGKPKRAGSWKFTWEPGHGDFERIDEEVHFDAARQLFVQKSTTRPYPGFARLDCDLNTASLTDFLARIRSITTSGIESDSLQRLIASTPPNAIEGTAMVPTFDGTQETLSLTFQKSAGGTIAIELATDSRFATALRPQLQTWCAAN